MHNPLYRGCKQWAKYTVIWRSAEFKPLIRVKFPQNAGSSSNQKICGRLRQELVQTSLQDLPQVRDLFCF